MSRSYHQKAIPHRYRKGPDDGKRKSAYWEERKHTKPNLKKEFITELIEENLSS